MRTLLLFTLLLIPTLFVSAQTAQYQPLVTLPGFTDTGGRTLTEYVNVLFRLAIGIGALIGVIKLVVAGVKYMGDDAFSSKAEAKKDIQGVLVGLLIMLSTVVILNTIWPGLTELKLLQNLPGIRVQSNPGAAGSGPTTTPSELQPTTPPAQQEQQAERTGRKVAWSLALPQARMNIEVERAARSCCTRNQSGAFSYNFDNAARQFVFTCTVPASVTPVCSTP